MAFVLDVNLRIQEILNLQKVEAALSKIKGTVQAGVVGGTAAGGVSGMAAASKAQAAAANANAAALNKVTVANNKLATSQSKTVGTTQKAAASMRTAGNNADSFGKSVAIAGKRYAAFLAATVIPFAALAGIGKATASVIEFNSAMLKMRQITGETEPQIAGIRDTILDLATSTGTSATQLADVGKVLAQAGQRGDELKESLSQLAKVPLTPSFESMDTAVEGLIAITRQFRREMLDTAEVFDVVTALSNKFAASAEDIFTGFTRGGAAFEAIGGTFREFASIFTTIRQATRESAATVGTFMKTISSRLADPKIVNFLEGKGIRISEAIEAGDPVAAIQRIATALDGITSIQDRIEIGTKLGGRRQISRLLALVSNVDILKETLETANSSAGEFGKVAEVGLQGLQAQLNILVQEFNKLVQTLAEPLFVPIIRGATSVGKAFVSFINVIKPVIPALTAIVGLAAGFKLLAISINAAGKALAFMSTVGVGGGIPGIIGAFTGTGAGAGGAAGATARERIKRRLAGGVGISAGGAAATGAAVGSRALGGLKSAATAPLGQLAGAAALILAADKLSSSFEETGNSSGILAAEFAKSAGVILVGVSLLSGKSITSAIGGIIAALGPWGAAIAAGVAALTAFTFAATKAVDFDVQNIIDAAAKKVSEIKIEPIEVGDREGLQKAVGDLGIEAIKGIQESSNRFEKGFSGAMAGIVSSLGNLFTGEGLAVISSSDAAEIVDTIVGNNPELLNEIIRSAVEQFGVSGLEGGLDQLFAAQLKGDLKVSAGLRQAIIKQAGGIEKIAASIDQIQLETKVDKMANAIEKAARDFETLHVPAEISSELMLLSTAVGNAARAIEINVSTFDQLSQLVGQDIGVAKPGTEFSREAVENIAKQGKLGDLIDLSQFEALEGFTVDMARVGDSLDKFMQSIIKSKANADSLRALLSDPQVDPFDILDDYIDKFIQESPDRIPPEAEAAFRAAAANLGHELKSLLASKGGVLPDTEAIQEAFDAVLSKQRPFFDAGITVFQTWLEFQAKQLNAALSGEELAAKVDVGSSDLAETVVLSLQNALNNVGIDLNLPGFDQGFGDANAVMVDLIQNGDLVGQVLEQFKGSYTRHAELNRQIAEAQESGEGASLGLLQASKSAAIEVLNLQVALTQLSKIAQKAPQALAEQQEERRDAGLAVDEVAAGRATKRIERFSQGMVEFINRTRQFIEAQTAIDVGQVFKEPAEIFAEALRESASAVKVFTSSLTKQDAERGFGVLGTRVTPEGRAFTERKPSPEAQVKDEQVIIERSNLQAALFGSEIGRVMETLLQSAATTAEGRVPGLVLGGRPEEAAPLRELAESLRNFKGFIFDIPKIIQESGLDPAEVARATAESLQEQAGAPGASVVENIGALKRTIGDLATSIQTLIERPEVARKPEELIPQLTPALQEFLQNLSRPTERLPESENAARIFQDTSASASDIKQGGADILNASQSLVVSAQQMQSIADIQREAIVGQQEVAANGAEGEGARDAIAQTTEAVNALGDKVAAVVQAVEVGTQQDADLAAAEQERPLTIDGLEENTEAISSNSDVAGKTQEGMAGLNSGMEKVAGAMQEGVGIDIETMSEINVNVQGVADAAKEFTSEFEAVATRVAKAEIRIVLQQLARSAGNAEAASTFESVVT